MQEVVGCLKLELDLELVQSICKLVIQQNKFGNFVHTKFLVTKLSKEDTNLNILIM